MSKAIQDNSDLRLMELAMRNPSLGGRELMLEVIERGPEPEEGERPHPRDIRTALKTRSLDDPDYRTQPQHANWIGTVSQVVRDLYERGAEIRGEILTIPAEEHEIPQDNETPFITTLSYAQSRIGDIERAREFHSLALAISGQTADARMQIAVFKHYYDRIPHDARGNYFGRGRDGERADLLKHTLNEMRSIADEMAKLETRESIEGIEAERAREGALVEERSGESFGSKMSVAARKINLRAESLRFPAGLSFETKERIVTKTIPEIDRRLEGGVRRDSLFKAINNTFFQAAPPDRTKGELEDRRKTATFLKGYIDERLRDPETRALNASAVFREARAAIIQAATPEALGRAAASILRANEQRSEALRQHHANPDRYSPPEVKPFNLWERNLLFNGRAPEHHTQEMRDLRIHYGLSRVERSRRTDALREGRVEPSDALWKMLQELDSRRTARAVAHFQASVLNERIREAGKVNLFRLSQQIAPHERAYLFELSEVRKKSLLKSPRHDRMKSSPATITERKVEQFTGREFGKAPTESNSFREYMASMGQIERQLLNKTVSALTGRTRNDLSITEARSLLPEKMRDEIRLRARNQAWERLIPEEVFDRNPLPEAVRISDTISHLQEYLQDRASIARTAQNDFVKGKVSLSERELKESGITLTFTVEDRKRLVPPALEALSPDDARRMAELGRYAAQTREDVYRGFELLDSLRRELELRRAERQSNQREVVFPRDDSLSSQAESSSGTPLRAETSFASLLDASGISPIRTQLEEGQLDRAAYAFRSVYVDSDHEWQFDSLRDVFAAQMDGSHFEMRDRGDWQHQR